MRRPDFGDSIWRKMCRKWVQLCESAISKHFLRHVFFVFPPALAAYVAEGKDKYQLLGHLGELGGFLQQAALPLLVGAWLWVAICKGLYSVIQKYARPLRELSRDEVLRILESVSKVVADKAARMDRASRELCKKDVLGAAEVFTAITQPRRQLQLLTTAVHAVFEALDNENQAWKARLCLVRDGRPVEWVHWEPYEVQPRVTPDELGAPASTLSRCIQTKDMVIVQDMPFELSAPNKANRRCIKGAEGGGEGSILCLPIGNLSNNGIGFVLCISSDSPMAICENLAELYRWILGHYSLRFAIEASLFSLKEKVNA